MLFVLFSSVVSLWYFFGQTDQLDSAVFSICFINVSTYESVSAFWGGVNKKGILFQFTPDSMHLNIVVGDVL